jgi:hypothetical protein
MRIIGSREQDMASFALRWLTTRKQPGKICRQPPILPFRAANIGPERQIFINTINEFTHRLGMARRSHKRAWINAMGVAGDPAR